MNNLKTIWTFSWTWDLIYPKKSHERDVGRRFFNTLTPKLASNILN